MPAPSPAAAPAAAASSAPTTAAAAATAAPAAAPATPKASTTRRPKNPYPTRKQPKAARRYEFRPPGPQNVRTRVGPPPAMAEKGGGILIGLVGYALTIRYLEGGWPGVQEWLKAKFLNEPTQPLEGKVGGGPLKGSKPSSTGGRKAA